MIIHRKVGELSEWILALITATLKLNYFLYHSTKGHQKVTFLVSLPSTQGPLLTAK